MILGVMEIFEEKSVGTLNVWYSIGKAVQSCMYIPHRIGKLSCCVLCEVYPALPQTGA